MQTVGAAPLALVVTGTTSVTGAFNLGGTSTKTFSGDVTLNAGAIWNETAAATINFGGSFLNNATTFTSNTGTHNFTGAGKTLGGSTTTVIANAAFAGSYTNDGTYTSTATLSGAGSLTQGATGVLNIGGTSTITTVTASAVGNTVSYTGGAQTVKSTNYHNLNLSGTGAKTLTTATASVGGNLTLAGTASTTAVTGLTIGGSATFGPGTSFAAGSFSHSIAGNWTNNGATINNTGSTITLNGSAQNIGGTSTTFENLALTGSNTKTFGVATVITGNLLIGSGVVANLSSFLTHTTNTLTLGGVGQAGGTWGGTTSAATNINSTFFATAAGILTVTRGPITYYSRLTGNWNVPATWSTAGFGLAPATSFPVAGDIANIGGAPGYTITVNVNSACASLSYIATQNYNSAVSINPGVSLNVAGAISLPTGNFNFPTSYTNTLAVGAGSLNAGSIDFNVTAAFGGNALTISTGTATISGDVTGGLLTATDITTTSNGLLRVGGAFLNPITCTFGAGTGTVEYFGTADQTIGGFTYNNLTISGSGVKTGGSAMDINGVITLGAGTSFTAGGYSHTLAGNWINNGSTIDNSNSTFTLDGTTQTIGGATATTFNNLTLTGGVKTFGHSTTMDGLLTINASAQANLGSFLTHTSRALTLGTTRAGSINLRKFKLRCCCSK